MSGAELNALIRVVAAEHPHADIRELARHVAKMTPDESVADFYTEALVDRIRHLVGQERRDAFYGPESQFNKNRSAKLGQRRSWWASVLESRVHVGNAQWLQLKDCRVEDLEFCIQERRDQIAGFENQITNFDHLIKLMVKHKAQKVSDLPEQTSWAGK